MKLEPFPAPSTFASEQISFADDANIVVPFFPVARYATVVNYNWPPKHGAMDENFGNEGVVGYQVLLAGTSIALPQLCTASDGRPCHILDQLPACNELLTAIRCRLDDEEPDKLSLVSSSGLPENSATEAERREACALIFWLLKSHRCLDTVELFMYKSLQEAEENQALILRSLRTAPALRKLKLHYALSSQSVIPELSCLSFLTLLETLECSVTDSLEMAAVLGPLLETSFSLTTLKLDVFHADFCLLRHRRLRHSDTANSTLAVDSEDKPGAAETVFKFGGFLPAECAAFLEELARNRTLRIVSIEDFQQYYSCLCRRGQRSNNGGVSGTIRGRHPEIILAECEQIRQVNLGIYTSEALAWFVTAAVPLGLCHRVTELQLSLDHWRVPTQESASVIAEFIKASNTLTRIKLYFYSSGDPRNLAFWEARSTFIRAVHLNPSIKHFILWYPDCTAADAEELACAIRESKSICYLDLGLGPDSGLLFIFHIWPRISRNYTLVRAHVRDIPHLGRAGYRRFLSVAARNRHLVARAAKFAAGSSSRACAEAMECVSCNPALVDKLCERASVDETEACTMISQSLRVLQDLDYFMQISGVVKRRVACHMDVSGGLQLDDVDQYSWRCVRKYLRLADVQK
ncbi:hypothetical protein HPB48_024554 [Haemaphysalis longicornis]|uniref:Uncharacterized protein n=1 Tax=Haemaphysalis longicornis TaxID=44386 RepID=A0A9J6H6S7_HAELO|nr:hypothetical protein HPB48_024554 [Haemaphysalis longicornis]